MATNRLSIAPFLGLATSLDPRSIEPHYAQDAANVRIEDGTLRHRYGYKALSSSSIPSGWVRSRGFWHVLGHHKTNYTELEEYLSVETAGDTRAWRVDPSTGARTEIKNGSTSVNLHDSDWAMVPFADSAYLVNPNGSVNVYKHTVGSTNSLKGLKFPNAPATPTYEITYGGPSDPYDTFQLAGLDVSTEVAYTGAAQASGSSVVTGTQNILIVSHTTSTGACSVTIDLAGTTAGARDLSNNDAFALLVQSAWVSLDVTNVKFKNASGTVVGDGWAVQRYRNSDHGAGNATSLYCYVGFNKKTSADRADWDEIRYVEIDYDIKSSSGASANNNVSFYSPIIGGIDYHSPESGTAYAVSYYNDTLGLESNLSPMLDLTAVPGIRGSAPHWEMPKLGVHLTVTVPSTSNGDITHSRLYAVDYNVESGYRKVGEQAIADLSYETYLTWRDWYSDGDTYPAYAKEGSNPFDGVSTGCAYKGWVIWVKKGGFKNVLHSRVGIPESLAKEEDLEEDATRGAIYTLPDEVLAVHPAGDAAIFIGSEGVWAQIGDRPSTMTPPHKLPGSSGCAGRRASCRWHARGGAPGVAFLSRHGDSVWFAAATPSFGLQPETGYVLEELSLGVRNRLRDHLLASGLDIEDAQLVDDPEMDSLWVVLGDRAAVLRRPSLLDGKRQWEFYSYTDGIGGIASSAKRRLKFVGDDGHVYDLEWDSAEDEYIEGALRDNGSAPPEAYWRSKVFAGPNRRVNAVHVFRSDLDSTPSLTVTSTRQTSTKTLAEGKRFVRFGPLQQGWEHDFKVTVPEGAVIQRIEIEEFGPAGSREKS